jgi:sulfopyruvate decarboxylase alpha subunit
MSEMGQARGAQAAPVAAAAEWPLGLYRVLSAAGVVQVAFVPDAGHARLIRLCQEDPAMRAVVLTSEQEGIGLLAGAWLGGARGVLLMQSSGVGNCVNALSMTQVCGLPLLMLVTMRGEWGEFNPWQVPMGQSTAAVLRASGVIVEAATEPERIVPTVEAAARLAFNSSRAVAVLISQRVVGTKTFGSSE